MNEISGTIKQNCFDIVSHHLGKYYQEDMFKELAEICECGRDQILLIEKSISSRGDFKNLNSFKLFFKYNQDNNFRNILKKEFQGRYIKNIQCWTIISDDISELDGVFEKNFSLIIDLSEEKIFFNPQNKKSHKNHYFVYKMIPYFIRKDITEIVELFKETMNINSDYRIYINNGESFERVEKDCKYVYTKSPFLLFSISFSENFFYFSYSVLGDYIDQICYGKDKEKNKLIARFKDPIHFYDFPIISFEPENLIIENELLKNEYYGLNEFKPTIKYVQSFFSDLKIAALSTDYMSLLNINLSGEIEQTNTLAYVYSLDGLNEYSLAIANYFGIEANEVIFFARNNIKDEEFISILIHEISHLMTKDEKEEHGILFAITNDMLQLLLNYKLHNGRSSIEEYNIKINIHNDDYISLLKNVCLPLLNQKIMDELLNIDYIRYVISHILID